MSTPSPIAQSCSSSIRPTKKSSVALSPVGNMSSGTTFRWGGKKDDLRMCPVGACGGCVNVIGGGGDMPSNGDGTAM
jgi:hypothetical protein